MAGQNEPIMGNEGSKMTILRPAYYGDWERNFCVFEASLSWGKTEDGTAGKQRERDRVRERDREFTTARNYSSFAAFVIARTVDLVL